MNPNYPNWLVEQKYAENTQAAQIHRVRRVEESYGSLDDHFKNGTIQKLVNELSYSRHDERENRPNPSKIKFEGNIRNNLQSYKSAVVRYGIFLTGKGFQSNPLRSLDTTDIKIPNDSLQEFYQQREQRFSLERDMQATLRLNIASLDPSLKIIDDGAERAVNTGFIDITCEDAQGLVIVELKAGTADSRSIGQMLGYMNDLYEEEDGKPVRGILVAHDFDKRTKSAARMVQNLTLKKYSIEFKFTIEE